MTSFSRKTTLAALALFLSVLAAVLVVRMLQDSGGATRDQIIKDERYLMGTSWLVQISLGTGEADAQASEAIEAVFSELSRIDNLMSEWKETSPVSSVNKAAGAEPVPVPLELLDLIERAKRFSQETEGAFDITWRGLAHLWHFDESFTVPGQHAIESALELVDYRKITIEGARVGLSSTGMALGLGGIAKGYAIDQAAKVLREHDFQDFLVNGGGDVLVAGYRGGRPWRIGVRAPRGRWNQLVARIEISGGAVVTSGDYERFRIVDGVRYHHIIDPRTGRPANACQSVTVVAPSAETADVLATAVFVLGPAKGLQLISARKDTEALVIDSAGEFQMSPGFKQLAEFY
jgi:thiamine biosynthesis lipoprotein